MAELVKEPLNPTQLATLRAKFYLSQGFSKEQLVTFDALSTDISKYLTDYYLLFSDFKTTLNEDFRKVYSDYSFMLNPINKAFEAYIKAIFVRLFGIKITKKTNETVGYYLNLPEDKKKNILSSFQKIFPFKGQFTEREWIDCLEALERQWKANRNPLTHPGEKVETLIAAEQIANSIIQEMKHSVNLINKEFLNPLSLHFQKEEKEEKKKIESLSKPEQE